MTRTRGAGSAGLLEYQVETSSGGETGKVMTVLRKGESIYLAVETGTPPIKRDLRAIPWGDVAEVDHAALTIRLRPSVDVDQALMLDVRKAVEDRPAVPTLAEPPEEGPGRFDPDASGPVGGPHSALCGDPCSSGLRPARTLGYRRARLSGRRRLDLGAACRSRRAPVGSSCEWLQAFPPTVRKQLNQVVRTRGAAHAIPTAVSPTLRASACQARPPPES